MKKRKPSKKMTEEEQLAFGKANHEAILGKRSPEGVFFDRRAGRWNQFDNWPKGKTRARISATRNGETSIFGEYKIADARKEVDDYIKRGMEKLGYERFAIIPQVAVGMDEAAKTRLRKASEEKKKAKKPVPAEEC